MKRTLSLLLGTVTAILLAAAAQAAEIVGTIVSTDPVGNVVVVKTPDGKEMMFRTAETTRIQQGGTTVELRSVQPGTTVQIMAEPASSTTTGTVVYPLATGIVVKPHTGMGVQSPNASGAPVGVKDDDDADVDREEKIRIEKDIEVEHD